MRQWRERDWEGGNMTIRIGILSFAHLHATSYAACLNQVPGVEFIGIADDEPARGQKAAEKSGSVPQLP